MVSSLAAVVVAISSLAASSVSGTTDLEWQSDYAKALEATRHNDRPLLVVLDVPGDPQEALETKQLDTKGEQSALLGAYQLCHVDVSTEYGKKVADAFRAKQFPFTAIIDKTGSVVLVKKAGQISSDEWEETLATYQSGVQSTKTYTTLYRGGVESASTISNGGCKACQLKAMQAQ